MIGLLGLTLVAGLAGGGAAFRLAGAAQPLSRLPAPKYLTPEALAAIKTRMGRHGNTMSNLVRAVVLIDRPTIRSLAGRIADEEIVARVEGGTGTPNRFPMPSDFFDQQDTLRAAAEQLALAAAVESDDKKLADHFAILARTCVACHSIYLRHDSLGRPADAKTSPDRLPE